MQNRRVTQLLPALLLAVLVGTVTARAARDVPPAAAVAGPGDFAGLVDIGGGRRLYLECRGSGSPTVVLEAGYRSPATVWSDDLVQPEMPRTMVFDGVAAFTRVCLYERPGVTSIIDGTLIPSRSDPVPMPRAVESVVADLHALLHAAHVPGPYVLAAHSFGGLLARLYAATYPDEVVGLVLVDAWNEELERFVTPAQWTAILRLNAQVPPELVGVADYETIDFGIGSAVMRRAAVAQPLRSLPLAVLARTQPLGIGDADPEISDAVFEASWWSAQEQLATLAPRARYVAAAESAHYVQLQQPELVTEAIRQVVAGVRHPDTWDDLVACCTP